MIVLKTRSIKPKKINDIIGKDFYLMIRGYNAKKRTAETMKLAGYTNNINFDGVMIELLPKAKGIEGFAWPQIDKIFYEDGTRVDKSISMNKASSRYLFTPETILMNDNIALSVTGQIKEYEKYDGVGETLDQKITVQFDTFPDKKTYGWVG